jgi:phosphohistidine phosphatase SixA
VVAAAAGPAAGPPIVEQALRDGADPAEVATLASDSPSGTLLVGHQPSLSTLASALAGPGGAGLSFPRPGWLVVLSREHEAERWSVWLAAHPDALDALS